MKFTVELTESQAREIAAALEDRAEKYTRDETDLECLLNLSLMRLEFLEHAERCLMLDRQAIREEYGI